MILMKLLNRYQGLQTARLKMSKKRFTLRAGTEVIFSRMQHTGLIHHSLL
jgi:hypothetical protein